MKRKRLNLPFGDMMMNFIPETKCVNCDERFNVASSTNLNASPKPGDFTLCIKCGQLYRFNAKLEIFPVELTEEVIQELNLTDMARNERVAKFYREFLYAKRR